VIIGCRLIEARREEGNLCRVNGIAVEAGKVIINSSGEEV